MFSRQGGNQIIGCKFLFQLLLSAYYQVAYCFDETIGDDSGVDLESSFTDSLLDLGYLVGVDHRGIFQAAQLRSRRAK
jgi:hypothetical protein